MAQMNAKCRGRKIASAERRLQKLFGRPWKLRGRPPYRVGLNQRLRGMPMKKLSWHPRNASFLLTLECMFAILRRQKAARDRQRQTKTDKKVRRAQQKQGTLYFMLLSISLLDGLIRLDESKQSIRFTRERMSISDCCGRR